MKTLKYLKDEYAKETVFYNNFQELLDDDGADLYYDFDEIAKRYARECAKATLEKAAESVITYHNPDDHKSVKVYRIHKTQESITNEENIVIL